MSDGEEYSTIRVDRVSLVERITLNRPEKRNALSFELRDELVEEILRGRAFQRRSMHRHPGCGPILLRRLRHHPSERG